MSHRTAVINVVGLSPSVLGPDTPRLARFAERHSCVALAPPLPAVTCPSQACMLTGRSPGDTGAGPGHGVVANGWFHHDLREIAFWKQSNKLVRGEKVWETARRRDPSLTCANLFWWFNMYSSADVSVTPRPIYKADGRKVPDCYSRPAELRDELQAELGRFPLFHFWGPAADLRSTRWIAAAALRVHERFAPTLALVYLPHLDYALQKFGPGTPEASAAAREVDAVAGGLIDRYEADGVRVIVVSEYGIEPVARSAAVNRALRDVGLLAVREELGGELLDAGASRAFAVADHQVAHVYVRDPGDVGRVAAVCGEVEGVGRVLGGAAQRAAGIAHPRAGQLVLEADPGWWFCYDYWLDDRRAPDFARTVDIHRKPGFDPRELFIDPAIGFPRAAIAWRLLKKRLGFRTLMDVIPLDASLVRGSHGRATPEPGHRPVLIADPETMGDDLTDGAPVTAVRDAILRSLFGSLGGA